MRSFKKVFQRQQYLFLIVAIICLALAGISRVSAEEPGASSTESVSTSTDDAGGQETDRVEKFRAEFQEQVRDRTDHIEESGAALDTRTQDRLINLGRNMTARMQAVADRFSDILIRLDRRIRILNESGLNTTEAEAHMESAKTSVETAKRLLAVSGTTVRTMATSDRPQAHFGSVRADFLAVQNALKDAHQALKSVLLALRNASADIPEETSDTDITAQNQESTL